jgi:hypothetical protein
MNRIHTESATRALFLALALVAFPFTPARAQGSGPSLNFDLSVRSAGMGGAADAICWDDLDHWSNPALLGYARGIRYAHSRTQLIPELADDIWLTNEFVQVGAGGAGVVLSGKPFREQGVALDYDPVPRSFERVRTFGAGVSLARLLESVCAPAGVAPGRWSRRGDVSVGMNWKELVMQLGGPGFRDSTESRDWGVHARFTPIDGFASHGRPLRVDIAASASVLGYNDDAQMFGRLTSPSPVPRQHRYAGAARVGWRRPGSYAGSSRLAHDLAEALVPLVTLTASVAHAEVGAGGDFSYKTDGWGAELTLANVISGRRGHYQDLRGDLDGPTWGWGAALPLGSLAGVRYDEAWVPQAKDAGLNHRHDRQFSAWLDPIAMIRLARARS